MIELILASTVMLVGDSHSVGPFGWYLDENLRKEGYYVATYASCGSIGKWWTTQQKTTCGYYSRDLSGKITQVTTHPTPKLTTLLAEVNPQAVIVELGSNYVKTPSDEFVKNDITTFVKTIKDSGATCFWISAPDMRLYRNEIARLDRLVNEAVGNDCVMFDSKKFTNYPATGGDGVHYWFNAGLPIARKWADGAFEAFRNSQRQ